MEVLPFDAAFLAVTIVLSVVLMLLRGRFSGQGMRDFLGVTTAFVILVFLTFQMIVGEHLLG